MLTDVTIQPVMFVLLFAFVFGGSIARRRVPPTASGCCRGSWPRRSPSRPSSSPSASPPTSTRASSTGSARCRSRAPSVLIGRSISSLIHSSDRHRGHVADRPRHRLAHPRRRAEALLAFALLLLFGFAMIWIGILVGSAMRSVEAVNGVMFTDDLPDHVPRQHLRADRADDRRGCARSPSGTRSRSLVAGPARALGQHAAGPPDAALPLHHPVLFAAGWSVLIAVAIAPLALRAFNRRTSE